MEKHELQQHIGRKSITARYYNYHVYQGLIRVISPICRN